MDFVDMKKGIHSLLSFLAIFLISCSQKLEITPEPLINLVPFTFEGVHADDDSLADLDNPDSKTSLGSDGVSINWTQGDKIAVFDNLNPTVPHLFTAVSGGTVSTSFTGEVSEGATHFLAVYPYEAAVADATTFTGGDSPSWYSNLIIPPVQTAVAGGFDPKALVAVGGTDSEVGKFRFRYTCSMLKFKVDYDNVTEVSFSSSSKNMSGIIQFTQLSNKDKGPSGIGNGIETYGARSKSVTLKAGSGETFIKDATYYAVVRYTGTTESNFYDGFTARLVDDEGAVATKVSSSTLKVERKITRNLGTLTGLTWVTSLYAKYMLGKDIVIAGKTYNKSEYGDAALISPMNLGGDNLNKQGNVVFLSPGSYSTGGEALFTHDIAVIGDNPEDIPVITSSLYVSDSGKNALKSWNLNGYSIALYNLRFVFPGSATDEMVFFTNKKAAKDSPYFIIDNCRFSNCPKNLFALNSSYLGYGIKDIIISKSVFETANTVSPALFNISSGLTNPIAFKTFSVKNSVFYHSSGNVVGWLLFNYLPGEADTLNSLTWPMAMELSNNIFYNIASNSSNARNYALTSLVIKNNLVVCPGYSPSNAQKIYSQRMKPAPSYFDPDYSNNAVFAAAGNDALWIVADNAFSSDVGQTKAIPVLAESPLEVADLVNGVFTVKEAFSTYGPQK